MIDEAAKIRLAFIIKSI